MDFCPADMSLTPNTVVFSKGKKSPAKVIVFRDAKDSPAKAIVDKLFKALKADDRGVVTGAKLQEIDRADEVYTLHGLDMKKPTLSAVDIQIALGKKNLDLEKIDPKPISLTDFADLLGGCFLKDIVLTKGRAIQKLSRNKEALNKIKTLMGEK